ncbi:TIR domain-containing protein [Flavobacterium sp. MAH-1]|uniref:TIR domain-containing protein n=1 Tax=Flavobacterium agri TaxID=2743471 RepID=A0A7Y8Y4U2_9FLAO|nr:TIR domain-containing protein [Flavobacterium agri]NUY81899.1 TIR domain-containing protein [Flavobacterium agri]NYA71923.1 TIR domain-containing protein [Flavobacterium agri]
MAYKKKVFISYDYDNDRHYKNLLLAWDAHTLFDFSLYDHSVDVSVNSTNANYIKTVITRAIVDAPYFLVIVGRYTHSSAWVSWEIQKAAEQGRRIIAVKTDRENISPPALFGIGASWAMSFTYNAIRSAIDNA